MDLRDTTPSVPNNTSPTGWTSHTNIIYVCTEGTYVLAIYSAHTMGVRLKWMCVDGVRLRWTHVDGEGVSSMWASTRKIGVADFIQSSSHAKKLALCSRISSLDGIEI